MESFFNIFKPNVAHCNPNPNFTPIEQLTGSASSTSTDSVSAPPPIQFDTAASSTLKRQPTNLLSGEVPPPPAQPQQGLSANNPGPFDKSDQDAQRILKPDIYDGARLEQNKPLGQNFSVSHSLWLGSALLPPPGNNYNFGTTLVLNEGRTMLLGRVGNDLRVDAQWHQEIIQPQRLVSKVISSITARSDQSVTHANIDYNGDDFNASLKLAKGPMVAASYFQKVSKNIALGGEGFHHTGQGMTHLFLRGKWASEGITNTPFAKGSCLNLTVSTMGALGANFVRKVSDRVSLACEVEYSVDSGQSRANVGYEFMLRQSKISGVIGTDGIIQNQLQEAIAPGFQIVFNSILDHSKDTHRFGYGVQIG
eukprot:augustus_masked-scaffold_7-processed-gene-11.67-mRNA-1 protein AED:0.10 eAED:0.11 QI:0/-1/0/1/-1/1/1/0/365